MEPDSIGPQVSESIQGLRDPSEQATTPADQADAPAEAVFNGVAARIADAARPPGARMVAKPGLVKQAFEAQGAGAITALQFGEVVEGKPESGK